MKSLKLICVLMFLGLFLSCEDKRIKTYPINIVEEEYIVKKIEPFGKNSEYYISTERGYFNFLDKLSFIDYNGKFKIGDTIIIKVDIPK